MKANVKSEVEGETRGIIILGGNPARVEPKLGFYMWCEDPGTETDSTTKAA
jgi:hypothetical protein